MRGFTKDGALVRTNRMWLFVASIALILVGFMPVVFWFASAVDGHSVTRGVLASGFIPTVVGLLYAWKVWWRRQRGQLTATERGLSLDGRRLVDWDEIRLVYKLERDGKTCVRFTRILREVEIEVAHDAEANALLTAMAMRNSK